MTLNRQEQQEEESEEHVTPFGVRFPKSTIERLDSMKGYMSRNKLILMAVDRFLEEHREDDT